MSDQESNQEKSKPEFLKGCFLVSNSTLQDPNFSNTVVLIIEHDVQGAFGIIVNRVADATLGEALDIEDSKYNVNLFEGGPVRPDALFILHGSTKQQDDEDVIEGVYMSNSRELLDALVSSENDFHVYHGYSGWAPGQLEGEIEANSWIIIKAKKELIFHPDPEVVWREALTHKGGLFSYFASNVNDPFLN